MRTKIALAAVLLSFGTSVIAQRQPRPDGPPIGVGMPRDQRPNGSRGPDGGWIDPHDTNHNGKLELDEFRRAVELTFADLDRDKNGTINASEFQLPARPANGQRPGKGEMPFLPPFFFGKRLNDQGSLTKSEFETSVNLVFRELDTNADGALDRDESREKLERGDREPRRQRDAPNARFIAAELRFGDRLVKGQPFSADILIEDTRRLFDGTAVTKQIRGATYRDGEGRTRREQPLEMVGGVSIVGENNLPQLLVFINDFPGGSQIFLDLGNKIARKSELGLGQGPLDAAQPDGSKSESLGTKMIEGVSAEGIRITFEIPIGQVGNDKPIQVVSERWFSPELQVLIMSKHLDPLFGEHIFRLVNLRRSEPAGELFAVPAGFKMEIRPARKKGE